MWLTPLQATYFFPAIRPCSPSDLISSDSPYREKLRTSSRTSSISHKSEEQRVKDLNRTAWWLMIFILLCFAITAVLLAWGAVKGEEKAAIDANRVVATRSATPPS